MRPPEIAFGIGTAVWEGAPGTVVVVKDHAAALKDIVDRYSTPGAAAPLMRELLLDWQRWVDWLRRLDLQPSVQDGWRPIEAVELAAPVQDPSNIFQTYHNYVRPDSITGRTDPPKSERLLPDIFLGSRSSLAGHKDVVYREQGGIEFDFELEITAVIGKTASRVSAEEALDYVAGYTIGNDLTMHFAWWQNFRQKTPISDLIRMKNFPGYTPLGPVIVPSEIVGDPHNLSMKATVDGVLRQDTSSSRMIWTVNELIEYLSWVMPLQPGDLIMTGSDLELPLPAGQKRGLKTGQTVICSVERLGSLETRIAEQDFKQPNQRPAVDRRR